MLEMMYSCVELRQSILGPHLEGIITETEQQCGQALVHFVSSEQSSEAASENWYYLIFFIHFFSFFI